MIVSKTSKSSGIDMSANCGHCGKGTPAAIKMIGYGTDGTECNWCTDCALQLVRMLSEDLCALLTKGGRHG